MPKDAAFGLILGVGLVVLIAVLFFHRDQGRAAPTAQSPPISSQTSGKPAPSSKKSPANSPAQTTSSSPEGADGNASVYSLTAASD